MTPHPKPRPKVKLPKPRKVRVPLPRASKRIERKKRAVGVPKHFDKRWRALRAEVIEDADGRCTIGHPGCEFVAATVHHTKYGKGRGVKSLLVPKRFLVACCWSCHKVVDPWLGTGFGLGSRQRNEEARAHATP